MNEGLLIAEMLHYAVCQQQYHKDDSSKIKNKSLEMINGTFYIISNEKHRSSFFNAQKIYF